MKYMTLMGAGLFVAAALSGCSAEVEPSGSESEAATSREELKSWGGSTPGSCLDRCLSLCPKDSQGGIDAGCFLTCLGACSTKAASISSAAVSSGAVLAP